MGKLPTCCGLVSDTANYLDMSRCRQQVRNKLAASRCNGIWETTRYNRHKGPARANLLRACCGLAMRKLRGNWCTGFWENLLRGLGKLLTFCGLATGKSLACYGLAMEILL